MICEYTVRKFCCEEQSKIENYDLAITDMKHTWNCHHRLEVGENGEVISRQDLINHGLYYDRPASELIFLTRSEHMRLHMIGNKNNLGNKHSEETRRKISQAQMGEKHHFFGKHHTEETKKKISEAEKGKHLSEETCRKISESKKGSHHSKETRRKISESNKGRKPSKETKRKTSESMKAYWEKKRLEKTT